MKKNVASQSIGSQIITASDGSDFTGTVTVVITKDNGTQTVSAGTAPAHEGNGYHSYTPTQAESNADHIAFTFSGTGAITTTVQLYTEFPQTVDNDTKLTTLTSRIIGTLATGTHNPATAVQIAVLSDWIDGGRLDLLLDAIKVPTDKMVFTIANQLDTNMLSISSDGPAADNLESTYDGSGYIDDVAPARQAQLAALTNTGSSVNIPSESYVLTTGTQSSGTIADTQPLDGIRHEHTDTAGALELYYQFDLGADGVPTTVKVTGRLNGSNDTLLVFAFNWDGTIFEQIGTMVGTNSSSDSVENYDLFTSHVGTGANLGKVRIRFFAASGLTTATLRIDQIFCSFSVASRSTGYSNGSIFIDTTSSNIGVIPFIDGTADRPVNSYANALTVATAVGLSSYTFSANDNITLTQAHTLDKFFGFNYKLAFANQIPPTYLEGAEITGIANSVATHFIRDSRLGTTVTPITLNAGAVFVTSGLVNVKLKDTAAAALDVEFLDCHGNTQGSMSGGTVDFGLTAGTNHEVSFQRWGGPVTIENLKAGDIIYAHGNGSFTLAASCTGGEFRCAGIINLIDNSGGAVTILDNARLTRPDITNDILDELLSGHTIAGSLAKAITDTETGVAALPTAPEIKSEVVDALSIDTYAQPTSALSATASITDILTWIGALFRNKMTQTATTTSLRNDGDTLDISTSAVSDDTTTLTRGKHT